ncbi:hypothetical protein E4P39_20580 [Blastococcus sp. CT_GayMR19]|uniref:sugar-transfer associated ATP-grasp domain-containing protein n=1 Tax=Blastococcus sp. CT_GayMR19 TaxID=2559608 RepID=UPI0010741C0E|nr:sugar-transfer associated ATP-grasp domain-containing protein [Blastococcus sp. CT_GayMR19]TFV69941.1 hypothetical protein E4P39_20580 [Blastococcus sp. CT_GayMR19]
MPVPGNLRPIAIAKRVRRNARTLALLVRDERASWPECRHPSMWRRGFLSSRINSFPDIEDPSVPYVSDLRFQFHVSKLNPDWTRPLLQDKNVFADALTARGLGPYAPEVYGIVTAKGFHARSSDALERLRNQDGVMLKPIRGTRGKGVRLAAPSEVEAMTAGFETALLVQERVTQHPAISQINPRSLNTLRLLAVRLPAGPVLAVGMHRWGTAESGVVDNIDSGGLASGVDLATGRLGPALTLTRDGRRVEFDRHPDTDAQITGVLVPQWSAVRELTERLMSSFPELDHIGWDVAVTERGPLVIEGNAGKPALVFMQVFGSFLHDPGLRDYYESKGLLPPSRQPLGGVPTGPRC